MFVKLFKVSIERSGCAIFFPAAVVGPYCFCIFCQGKFNFVRVKKCSRNCSNCDDILFQKKFDITVLVNLLVIKSINIFLLSIVMS